VVEREEGRTAKASDNAPLVRHDLEKLDGVHVLGPDLERFLRLGLGRALEHDAKTFGVIVDLVITLVLLAPLAEDPASGVG
jgi:hypothetical protein